MKKTVTIVFTFLLTTVYAQTDDFKIYLDSAKTLFKSTRNLYQEEFDKFDFNPIASMLEKAVELNPVSAEARYFLGYAYSRINASDSRGMITMSIDLMYKCSEQFEKVIELTPKYTGELIVLDPYSKLTGEWGSMAMCYWHHNNVDSARWAFQEGKKRGGFREFILELNKKTLDACSKNAILISYGDNSSIPLWYLQIAENYRTDVSVVDINVLNTIWYPLFLSETKLVAFDFSPQELDTIEYIQWTDQKITINNFSWTVKPSYYDYYLLRGDRIFLSLLKENKFERDLFFTAGFPEFSMLSLQNFLSKFIVVDQLTPEQKTHLTFEEYQERITNILSLSAHLDLNSTDELNVFDYYRYDILNKINDCLEKNEKEKAKELFEILDRFGDENKFPYQNEKGKKNADNLRQKI